MQYDIRDLGLASKGKDRIEWADDRMPVLRSIRSRFQKDKPFAGLRIGGCLHVTTETANLMRALAAGGAEVVLCASNPLSTQDDVAASLVADYSIPTFAINGEDAEKYYGHINNLLDIKPQIILDDGADVVSTLHTSRNDVLEYVIGATEETTTGLIRLRSMEREDVLRFPVVAVNDARTKHFFDNSHGVGQSTLDGIMRATNILLSGTVFVVCGFGWCGRGVATRARGMGASVIVTEIDPVRALEARMDGFRVMPIDEAASVGDLFCTLTGNVAVIGREHFEKMKDGAIVCNSGHFNVEVDMEALEDMSTKKRRIREHVDQYTLPNGHRINALGEGRLINLAAAEGHPASVMDMSFANQALVVEYLIGHHGSMKNEIYTVPDRIDVEIAKLKLHSMDCRIDSPTDQQARYQARWDQGT